MAARTYDADELRARHEALCKRMRECRNAWAELYPQVLLLAERRGIRKLTYHADRVEASWQDFEEWLKIPSGVGGTAAVKAWLDDLEAKVKDKEKAIAGTRAILADAGPLPPPRVLH